MDDWDVAAGRNASTVDADSIMVKRTELLNETFMVAIFFDIVFIRSDDPPQCCSA